MKPITITRTENEFCYIEAAVNSCRISFSVAKNDLEILISDILQRFLSLRADRFKILRKAVVDNRFDFCFLITDDHLQKYKKEELVNFILEFI